MAYMKVVFLLAAAFLSVTYCFSYSKPVYTRNLAATVCEGKNQHIQCGSGELINIISASFGRKSRNVCPSSAIKTTNCHSTQSLTKVKASCNRKSSCELTASTSIFGDPCFGTYKYLTIQYQCVLSGALGNGGGCKVQLFQHNGYKGVVDTYTQGGNVKRNDDMSSLKVEGGCCVVIYEHYNWKGKNQKYCKNTGSIGGKWNDKVSSIKIVSHDENEEGLDEKYSEEEEDAEDENEDEEENENEVEDEYELSEEEDEQDEDDDESKEE